MKKIIILSYSILSFFIFLYLLLTFHPKFILEILPAWIITSLFLLACLLLGLRIDSIMKLSKLTNLKISLYFFLGSTSILLCLIILLFLHLFYKNLIIAIIILSIILNIKLLKSLFWELKQIIDNSLLSKLILIQSLIILFGASTPPYFYDSLIYHLAFPYQYLKHHKFIYTPDIFYSSFPMNANLFFAIPLSFNSDISAQMLSFLFAIMTVIAIKEFASSFINNKNKSLPSLIFITTPVVPLTAILPAIDLHIAFYSCLCFIFLYFYLISNKNPLLCLSALSAGIALGIKYTFIPYLAMMIISIIFIQLIKKNDKLGWASLSFASFTKWLLIAIITASPWYIKNFIYHKDPFYPYFSKLSTEKLELIYELTRRVPLKNPLTSLKYYLSTPIIMNFKNMGAAGILGPFFIMLLPFLFYSEKRKSREFKFFTIISIAGIITFVFTPHLLRYFSPSLPFLCIIYSIGLSERTIIMGRLKNLLIFLAISLNIFIFINHLITFQILQFPLGYLDRQAFLENFMEYYNVAKFAEKNLSPEARILFVGEARTFYFKQDCYANHPSQEIILEKWIKKSQSLNNFLNILKEKRIDYILFNYSEIDRIKKYIKNKNNFFEFSRKEEKIFDDFMQNNLELIYRDRFIELYKIKY